jgi:hypothetical protein
MNKRQTLSLLFLCKLSICVAQNPNLIGLGYSFTSFYPNDRASGISVKGTEIKNTSSYEINFYSFREESNLCFRHAITYTPVEWTYTTRPDARYSSFTLFAPKEWVRTQTYSKMNDLGLSSYLILSSDGESVKAFLGIGIDVRFHLNGQDETFETNRWHHYDSTSGYYILDSTTTRLLSKKSTGFQFGKAGLGLQAGGIVRLWSDFYFSLSGKVLVYSGEQSIPLFEKGFIYTLDFGLHYKLSSKTKTKAPPN